MNNTAIEQPRLYEGAADGPPDGKRANMRITDSIRRLKNINFDPLDKLVETYYECERENERYKQIRMGQMLNMDGKTIRYSAQGHVAVLALMQKTANDLMRYKYGRVPESIELDVKRAAGMTIMLAKDDGSYREITADND